MGTEVKDRSVVKLIRVTMPIYGLACGGGGALTIERVLQRVAGVRLAYVNPATEMAYVEYDPALCGPGNLLVLADCVGSIATA